MSAIIVTILLSANGDSEVAMILNTVIRLGQLVRARRLELGLTQLELAGRVGVTRQWVIALEKGKPRAELGPVLKALFELDLDLTAEPTDRDSDLEAYVRGFSDGGAK